MKKNINNLSTPVMMALLFIMASFTTPAPVKYQVDTQASTLGWTAHKVTGSHTGTAPIHSGEIITDGKTIKQGSFEIDLASLKVTDITDAGANAKLTGHLKSEDFFSTAAHPKATFVIGSVTPQSGDQFNVKGKLTIKGITKDLEFPATIKSEGKKITALAKIKVDRTLYDIRFRSASYFENLGDKAIDNEFELDLKLVANSSSGI